MLLVLGKRDQYWAFRVVQFQKANRRDLMATESYEIDICLLLQMSSVYQSRVKRQAKSLASSGRRVLILSVASEYEERHIEIIDGYTVLNVPTNDTHYSRLKDVALKLVTYALVLLLLVLPQRTAPWRWIRALFVKTSRLWLRRYRIMLSELKHIQAEWYQTLDYLALVVPPASGIPLNRVIYDSHELFFDQYQPPWVPRWVTWLATKKRNIERTVERDIARACRGIITVSPLMAAQLAENFDVPPPTVIRHLTDSREVSTPACVFPTEGYQTIVHTGNLHPGRQLHELVRALALLPDNIALVLLGRGWLQPELEALGRQLGIEKRFFILPPVETYQVVGTIQQAQAAAVLNSKGGLNREVTYPFKLFEAIGAGLPIVTSKTASLLDFIENHEVGTSADANDPASIAASFQTLLESDNYERFRQNVLVAREILDWKNEEKKLFEFYDAFSAKD